MKTKNLWACVTAVLVGAACMPQLEGAPCSSDDNCPLGQSCGADGTCRLGPPSDGGAGGGGADGGGLDGGGAVDGGSIDAGPADAGSVDGGGMDAGGVDGGDLDGGSVDAGVALLTANPMAVDYGDVTVGATSATRVVTISNTGTVASGALAVVVTGADASMFRIFSKTCTSALAAGSSCQVEVVFEPTADGMKGARLDVSGMPGGVASAVLTGQGRVPAMLSLSSTAQDFGTVVLGSTAMKSFTVTNTGGSTTGLVSATVGGADGSMFIITANTCTAPLTPGAMCTVTVTFGPSAPGARTASLEAAATPGGMRTVSMTGSAQTPASLSWAASQMSFGFAVVGSTGSWVTYTFTNQGQAPTAMLTTAIGGGNSADFSLVTDTCAGTSVAGGARCTVVLEFKPSATGARSGSLTVSGAGLVPAFIPLGGTGQAPAKLELSTMVVGFGSVVTATSSTATISVTNTGDVATGTPMFSVSGAPFSVDTNTCGASVAPGTNCAVTLRFSPLVGGSFSGVFTAAATPGGTVTATLSGTGMVGSTLSISPSTYSFGSALLSSMMAFQTFTVTNAGSTAVSVSAVPGGANASSFVKGMDGCATATLAPNGGTCTFRITFSPQAAGALAGFVQVSGGSQVTQATLSGTGLRPAALSISPSTFTWPTTTVSATGATTLFTVTNTGDVASGNLTADLAGSNPSQFSLASNTCGNSILSAQGACTIGVQFAPNSSGMKSATLSVTGNPGGTATAALNGTAQTAANLTLTPVTSADYGNVRIQGFLSRDFTLANTGEQASGPVSLTLTGPDAAMFSFPAVAGLCTAGQPLAGGATCTVRVRFTANSLSTNGTRQAILTASAMLGGAPTLTLIANAQRPAQLTSAVTSNDFGGVEVGQSSGAFVWTIRNDGDIATMPLMIQSNTNAAEFMVTANTCNVALAGGASCAVTIVFTPAAGGPKSGTLSLGDALGSTINLAMSGKGQWRLRLVTNNGTVSTKDGRLSCGAAGCSALYDDGAAVTVNASSTNGSGVHFASWQAPTPSVCLAYGNGNACQVAMTASTTVSANFQPIDANLAFVSSVSYPPNLGVMKPYTAPYDAACNALASAAGINNATGNGYVAWISTGYPEDSLASRLGSGKGAFMRLDRALFASSQADLQAGKVLNPLNLDEYGKLFAGAVWTGTNTSGGSAPLRDCNAWTSNSGIVLAYRGVASGGPGRWTVSEPDSPCSATNQRIYCLMKTLTNAVLPPSVPAGGKIIYVTAAPWAPGGGLSGMSTHCNNNKPIGYTNRNYVALVATSTTTAGSRLVPIASYYRPDGVFVGTGDSIRLGNLRSGIWQNNNLNYVSTTVWAGAADASSLGSTTSTCDDWTSSMMNKSAMLGRASTVGADFFNSSQTTQCNMAQLVYCVEQ